jgi:Phage tail baseplate hub (GPD)
MAKQRLAYLDVWIDGKPMPDAVGKIRRLEVDERTDDISSFHITLDMAPGPGDWSTLADGRFALLHRVTVGFGHGPPDTKAPDVKDIVFDGYITAVEPVFGVDRTSSSSLELYGLDAACLMHLEERQRRFEGITDAEIVKQIYAEYGFATAGDAIEPTKPSRDPERGTMMQRGTDADFIRMLARRNGFEAYVERTTGPVKEGAVAAAENTGHFHRPRPDGAKQPTLALTPHQAPTLIEMKARWESHRPTEIRAEHIDERTRRIQSAKITQPRFARMGKTSRGDVLKSRLSAILPKRPDLVPVGLSYVDVPHQRAEVDNLAWSDFLAADWFVEATARVRAVAYPKILRARRPVDVAGAGKLLDGTWYVKSVRHRWTWGDARRPSEDADQNQYELDTELVRDALNGVG